MPESGTYGSTGMDAPTRTGTDVPEWRCCCNHLNSRSVRHEDYDSWY
jgi:hypothetical protein